MYNNDPREITAKFNCKCAESGVAIAKGTQCIYYPSSKSIFALNTKQAQEYYEWRADISMGYNY